LQTEHIVVGGASPAGDSGVTERYDPAADTWQTDLAPMPTPRHGLGVVAVGGAIYVLGGGPQPGDTRSNLVEVFRLP